MITQLIRSLFTIFGHIRRGPFVGAAGIVIKDGKVLLNKERLGYSLPGGLVSYNEDPQDTVLREIKEETGLDAKVIRRVDVLTEPRRSPTEHAIVFLYECEVIDGELKGSIEGKPEWVEIDKIPDDMQHGFTEVLNEYFSKR